MIVGVPTEIKVAEQRIALLAGARAFSDEGYRVLVEVILGAGPVGLNAGRR